MLSILLYHIHCSVGSLENLKYVFLFDLSMNLLCQDMFCILWAQPM